MIAPTAIPAYVDAALLISRQSFENSGRHPQIFRRKGIISIHMHKTNDIFTFPILGRLILIGQENDVIIHKAKNKVFMKMLVL